MWLDSLPIVRNEGIFEGRLVATPESLISLSRSSRSRHHIEGMVTGLDVLCLGLRFEQNQEVYSFLHTASLQRTGSLTLGLTLKPEFTEECFVDNKE